MPGRAEILKRQMAEIMDGVRQGLGSIYRQLTVGTTKVSIEGTVDDGNASIVIDGNAYALVLIADANGEVVLPLKKEDLETLLSAASALLCELQTINRQLADITGQEDPL